MGRTLTFQPTTTHAKRENRKKAAQLSMFLGSDGGILGIGAPEVVSYKNHGCFSCFVNVVS